MTKPAKSSRSKKSNKRSATGQSKNHNNPAAKKTPGSRKSRPPTKVKSNTEKEFDQFRHEIYKFGLSGLNKKDQVDARIELAIKLGARPKKWIKPIHKLGAEAKEAQDKLAKQSKADKSIV